MSCMTEVERMIYENCRNVAHGRQTNFQRITATPEALAELMQDCVNCDDCPVTEKSVCQYKYENCKEAWLEWLKQENEDENVS